MKEQNVSMIAQAQTNGRLLDAQDENIGAYMPSFAWGGVRPEFMVSGQTLVQYFLKQEANEAEAMNTTTSLRGFAAAARQMVPNPDAFGTANTALGNIPDWFNLYFTQGVEAGPVRPQFPPIVRNEDPTSAGLGNIVCV